MSINLTTPESQIRETRLSSITGYKGSIKDLATQASGCSLKSGERGFTQTTACSLGCAQGQLVLIKDAAVVGHSAIGCGSDTIQSNINIRRGQASREWEYSNINYINTNMTEEATVFGGTAKLREGIREAYRRFNPKVIFVTTSCVSGIIGENISGILEGLAEEIPVPLVPVHCEGFRSKLWASGFDAAFHAILTYIVKPAEKKNPKLVNIINFSATGRDEVIRLLGHLDLVPQFVVQFTTIEQLTKLSEAVATLSFCGTLGSYLASGLEEHFGVPYIKSLQPHGIAGIDSWLRGLGKELGKEADVEKLIVEEKAGIAPELAELREKLTGKQVVIGMGPSFAQNYTRVLQELALEVAWTASWHFDQRHDYGEVPATVLDLAKNKKDILACVSELQVHEITNLLLQLKPDIFICRHPGMAIWSAKLGIPTIFINDEYQSFGYQGLINFGNRVADALANPTFVKYLASKIKLPYTNWWLEQDAFKFLGEASQKKQKLTKAVV